MSISKCKDCRYCDRRKFNSGKWYCQSPQVSIFSLPVDKEKCFEPRSRRESSMSHIETLIMNEVRKALESLERSGVGYIDMEQTGVFHYTVDDTKIRIAIEKAD